MAELVLVDRPELVWPAELPWAPLVSGFGKVTPAKTKASPVDAGAMRSRRWAASGYVRYTAPYDLTDTQQEALELFEEVVAGCVFRWPHPNGQSLLTVPAMLLEKSDTEGQEYKLITGIDYNVILTIAVMPRITFTETGGWPWRRW